MKTFETVAQVGTDGSLTLERLPFASGESVRIRVDPQSPADASPPVTSREEVERLRKRYPMLEGILGTAPGGKDWREILAEGALRKHA